MHMEHGLHGLKPQPMDLWTYAWGPSGSQPPSTYGLCATLGPYVGKI